jgi:dethiobiotin synthetase
MNPKIVITGTDTGIGKTVFAAGLTALLRASYWKPVQAGLDGETDSQTVARLGRISPERIITEAYLLNTPVSPHQAAKIDGLNIELDQLDVPAVTGPLIIEGAGGLMVPLNQRLTMMDLFGHWGLPVVLCARTGLGTINHTLLSIEALRTRNIALLGVVFIGPEMPATQEIIADMAKVSVLGRLPFLNPVTPQTLLEALNTNFEPSDFSGIKA